MRKLGLTLALLAGVVVPAAAQGWQPEIGIRGGFASVDFTDLDATLTTWDLPGVGGINGGGGIFFADAPLYGIIPMGERMALQPSFGFQNVSVSAQTITTVAIGARINYSVTPNLYVAAGPTAYIVKSNGVEDTQGALEGAFGYRRPIGSGLRVHAEAFYQMREESELVPKATALGVRIGAGATLGGERSRSTRRGGEPMWRPAVVLQGGWSLVSAPDVADVTFFALPFAGSSIIAGSLPIQGPNALSVVIPMGERMAIEPSVDVHNFKPEGSDAITSYSVGARLNYAFNRSAYAAAGANLNAISADGVDDGSSLAWLVAGGFRFPLVGAVSGRTEINYRVFDGSDIFPSGQATSFVFGVVAPID